MDTKLAREPGNGAVRGREGGGAAGTGAGAGGRQNAAPEEAKSPGRQSLNFSMIRFG